MRGAGGCLELVQSVDERERVSGICRILKI